MSSILMNNRDAFREARAKEEVLKSCRRLLREYRILNKRLQSRELRDMVIKHYKTLNYFLGDSGFPPYVDFDELVDRLLDNSKTESNVIADDKRAASQTPD